MPCKRVFIAAAVLLAAVYLKYTLPEFSESFMPGFREVLGQEQVALYVPEEWLPWLRWN